MRMTLGALTMLVLASAAQAEAPRGPDAIHGAFTRMLDHCNEVPRATVVQGEPDPFGAMVAEALQAQQQDGRRLVMQAAAESRP